MLRKCRIAVLFILACFVLPASASETPGEIDHDIENNPVCRGVSNFIVGASAVFLFRGANAAVAGGMAAVMIDGLTGSIQDSCQRELEEFVDYYERNPIIYDDYVREECGGNPFNCPGNFGTAPSSCGTFMVCTPYIFDYDHSGVSISRLSSTIQNIGLAYQLGGWGPVLPTGPIDERDIN